jgi:hypothetical protein
LISGAILLLFNGLPGADVVALDELAFLMFFNSCFKDFKVLKRSYNNMLSIII